MLAQSVAHGVVVEWPRSLLRSRLGGSDEQAVQTHLTGAACAESHAPFDGEPVASNVGDNKPPVVLAESTPARDDHA